MLPNLSFKDIMTKTQTNDFFIACKQSRIESTTSFYGCFYIGPFDETLSQTLANDLRRTLLSELTGLAITKIEIEGVLHKFSTLQGMKESVLDLICNLQNVVLKKKQDDFFIQKNIKTTKKTYTGFLKVSGPRIIKAIDLKLPQSIQCVDPNQYIATLAEDGILNMKFSINEGKNIIKQKTNNLDVTTLKKRNILIQNFKKNLTTSQKDKTYLSLIKPPNTSSLELNQETSFSTFNSEMFDSMSSVAKSNYTSEFIDKTSNKGQALSNVIPLDAVFMPVTKVNCIIEENNLYSDFSTDFSKNYNNPILESKKASFLEQTLDSTSMFHLSNYNSIYENCLLLKTNKLNKFKNKLLPWQSNNYYYNLVPTTNFLDKTLEVKYAPKLTKLKTFLGLGSSFIIPSSPSLKRLSLKNLIQRNSQGKITNVNQKESLISTNNYLFGKSTQYKKLKTILKTSSQSFKINSIHSLNNEFLTMEYSKILELKPLRKKAQLIVEIWTNGSIHPREALYKAFSFLANNFLKLQNVKTIGSTFKSDYVYSNIKNSYFNQYSKNIALNNTQNAMFTTPKVQQETLQLKKINQTEISSLSVPIALFKMSLRTYTALKKAGIFTLHDLLKHSKNDLLKTKNLGTKSLYEIENILANMSLSLKN
jgi:DNA-directed RNA polymerase subunit alpha